MKERKFKVRISGFWLVIAAYAMYSLIALIGYWSKP